MIEINFEVECPACYGKQLFEHTILKKSITTDLRELRKKIKFNKYSCLKCGLGFINSSKRNELYKAINYKDYNLNFNKAQVNSSKNISKNYLNLIRNQIKIDKDKGKEFNNIIEVGCGDGYIIEELIGEYKEENILGIDPFIKNSKSKYFLRNENSINHSLINKNLYDIVFSVNVAEHIEDLEEELKSIKNMLNDDGVFICIVPNVRIQSTEFIFCDHLWSFTIDSMQRFGNKVGLELMQTKVVPKIETEIAFYFQKKKNIASSYLNNSLNINYSNVISLREDLIVRINSLNKLLESNENNIPKICFGYGEGAKLANLYGAKFDYYCLSDNYLSLVNPSNSDKIIGASSLQSVIEKSKKAIFFDSSSSLFSSQWVKDIISKFLIDNKNFKIYSLVSLKEIDI